MADVLQIGQVGAGRIGRIHAAHLARQVPRARLSVIADVVPEAAQACAVEFGIPRVTTDFRSVLQDQTLQAVVIATSTRNHADMIEAAAAAGKHVFCEKPIDLSLERIDRCLEFVNGSGVKFQLGFNRRFDSNALRLRQAVEQGEVGRPWRVHIVSRDPLPLPVDYLKTSGGMFMDLTIHDFDMARFLIGSEVEEVFSSAGALVDPAVTEFGDVDTAVTVLRFVDGTLGSIDNSRGATYGYDQRLEVFGSVGMLATANRHPNDATISDARSVHRDLPHHFFLQRYRESFLAELTAFVDCVLDDTPVPVTGADGRAAAVVALAAQKSLAERRLVHLAEIG